MAAEGVVDLWLLLGLVHVGVLVIQRILLLSDLRSTVLGKHLLYLRLSDSVMDIVVEYLEAVARAVTQLLWVHV